MGHDGCSKINAQTLGKLFLREFGLLELPMTCSHDYSRTNTAVVSGSTSLYLANYIAMNSDFRVYICLHNGIDPDNPTAKPSLDEPTFTDLEPRSAGTSGDGAKYLYSIKPSDVAKFESTEYLPVPSNGRLLRKTLQSEIMLLMDQLKYYYEQRYWIRPKIQHIPFQSEVMDLSRMYNYN